MKHLLIAQPADDCLSQVFYKHFAPLKSVAVKLTGSKSIAEYIVFKVFRQAAAMNSELTHPSEMSIALYRQTCEEAIQILKMNKMLPKAA